MKLVKDTDQQPRKNRKISDATAEEAVRTIIQWIGEDPEREGHDCSFSLTIYSQKRSFWKSP